jgi:hypothetical protein
MPLPSRTGDPAFQDRSSEAHVIFLKGCMLFWSEISAPCEYRAPFPPMIMIFGAGDTIIGRDQRTWGGAHLARIKFIDPESADFPQRLSAVAS